MADELWLKALGEFDVHSAGVHTLDEYDDDPNPNTRISDGLLDLDIRLSIHGLGEFLKGKRRSALSY